MLKYSAHNVRSEIFRENYMHKTFLSNILEAILSNKTILLLLA